MLARSLRQCGSRGNLIDMRPNWKEQPAGGSLTGRVWGASAPFCLLQTPDDDKRYDHDANDNQ
jgi:hypothetical protein